MNIDIMTLCDYAQESNGKVTIVGTFNKLIGETLPAQHNMYLFIRIGFEGEETKKNYDFKIIVKKDDVDNPLVILPISLNNSGDGIFMYANININLNALLFPEVGTYRFKLQIEDLSQEIPLFVTSEKY